MEECPDWFSYADVVWQALYQEGIYANMTVHPLFDGQRYADISEAVLSYANMLSVTGEEQKAKIEQYLTMHLIRDSNGKYMLPEGGHYAHIWWDKI